MNKVVIKKTNQPWKYCVTINGIDLPFVTSVEIEREKTITGDVGARVVINMIAPTRPIADYEVIIDEIAED